jgi:hypothetical protein
MTERAPAGEPGLREQATIRLQIQREMKRMP